MKSTGIVRKMDTLGRIVIPIELRRTLGIEIKDAIEIFVDKESIILRKFRPACFLCDSDEALVSYEGKQFCKECLRKINELAEKS
ncbi:AbrB/MazE/SpoVT family DNA-binding domain-containing protein [Christensenellaceae bacterium OttesenSCG-928-M15]|nr:AbrB/MazE/SpoVT family DNA-binding domain-containing protein [Christensenellaceae bacterium OttesenSCG-928-M15]